MKPFEITYKRYGARAILVEWPARISDDILKDIMLFKDKIYIKNIKVILELKSGYNSLLIVYEHIISNLNSEIRTLNKIYNSDVSNGEIKSNLWKIPVCYDDVFGLDLKLISEQNNISRSVIIKRHSQAVYTVYFIGFLPGFLYLGGLDKTLHVPRKSTPRLQIQKGAVAIGGNQTGIYPNQSPGGWNIIGNSPINFFDVSKEAPCFAKAGDGIQFYPISLKTHHDTKTLVDAHVYQMESEVRHG